MGFCPNKDARARRQNKHARAPLIFQEPPAIHLFAISRNFASRKNTYCADVIAITNP